jgi:TolB protein
MNYIRFFFLILAMPIASWENSSIFVELKNDFQLVPISLPPFKGYNSQIPASHLERLHQILTDDLNYNGMTKVSDEAGSAYKIVIEMSGIMLNTRIESPLLLSPKWINNIPLSGTLSTDRQEIHKLADALHKTLFNQEGIASSKILYTRKTKEGSELAQADWDGHNLMILQKRDHLLVTPQYIPTERGKIPSNCIFVSYELGQPKVYSTSTKHSTPQRLTLVKGNQLCPTISRQKDKMAFINDSLGNPDIFLLEFNHAGIPQDPPRRIYTFPKATQSSPTFSPDGSQIAFVSNKDGTARIYTMHIPPKDLNIRRIQPKLITTYARESSAPAWSPDGKKIAYCAKGEDGLRQIWTYDFDKKEERQLTFGPYDKENPSWAPNSLHLIFNVREKDNSTLYIVNLHQTKAHQVYTLSGENRFPSWGG